MSLPRIRPAALLCLVLFAAVSVAVVSGATGAVDINLLHFIGSVRAPTLTSVMQGASAVGNWQWEVPLVLLTCALLWRRGRRGGSWRYFVATLSTEGVYAAAKAIFHRPRPTVISHLGQAGWFSYPSGHAMLAPFTWGLSLVLISQLVESRELKMSLRVLAVVIPGVIAISRVYLGVHYLTDVLGGIFLGLALIFLWWDSLNAKVVPAN